VNDQLIIVVVAAGAMLVMVLGALVLLRKAYRAVPSGKALIIDKPGRERSVSFTAAVVFPGINTAELLDVTAKTVRIERGSKNPLVTRDGVHMYAKATFVVSVNRTTEDVLKVAETYGVERASQLQQLAEHFTPRFDQGLETVFGAMNAEDVVRERVMLVDQLIRVIGVDLNGFRLDDVAVHDVLRADA
jgi:uncharacterized membrane protein YqiK